MKQIFFYGLGFIVLFGVLGLIAESSPRGSIVEGAAIDPGAPLLLGFLFGAFYLTEKRNVSYSFLFFSIFFLWFEYDKVGHISIGLLVYLIALLCGIGGSYLVTRVIKRYHT